MVPVPAAVNKLLAEARVFTVKLVALAEAMVKLMPFQAAFSRPVIVIV